MESLAGCYIAGMQFGVAHLSVYSHVLKKPSDTAKTLIEMKALLQWILNGLI